MSFVSYAQNYEDVMLHRALSKVARGFYVDVGAQHPIVDSVTKAFYEKGWRGINIEPVATWHSLLQEDRPHDLNLNVAVGDELGELVLFEVEGTGLSTTDSDFAERHRGEGHSVLERRIVTRTLDDIFAEHQVREVHFLKIDCEGAEATALAGLSLNDVRPWIIVLEAMEPNRQAPTHTQWEHLLTGRGYQLAYRDGLNRYYVANEHSELLGAFDVPPNVFDDFVHYGYSSVRDELSQTHIRLQGALATAEEASRSMSHLSESIRFVVEEQSVWRARETAERDGLKIELANTQKELERNRRARKDMQPLLDTRYKLMAQVEDLQSSYDSLRAQMQSLLSSKSWRLMAPLRFGNTFAHKVLHLGWRIGRPGIARAARLLRPFLKRLSRSSGVRSVAGTVLRPDTRLGNRVRSFLFESTTPTGAVHLPLAMSADARAVEIELRTAIAKSAGLLKTGEWLPNTGEGLYNNETSN